jgi:hypothetical protein
VNELADAIAVADENIARAQSELARFDEEFDRVDEEGTAANEHAWRADLAVQEATEASAQTDKELVEEKNERHEEQVPTIFPLRLCGYFISNERSLKNATSTVSYK